MRKILIGFDNFDNIQEYQVLKQSRLNVFSLVFLAVFYILGYQL